jgi:hypothetical protein
VRWLSWLPWWPHPLADGEAARQAQADAQRKLADSRREAAPVHRQIDSFTAAVDRAMKGRR